MKVIVGRLYHESNTFNSFLTEKEDFVYMEGRDLLEKFGSVEVFQNAGLRVVPTVNASALPSGIVSERAYRFFADKILNVIKQETNINGIWLHLHGAMTVENIGSAELQLLKEIRELIGFAIPISLTLDIHGNIPKELMDYVNIVRSYRTVPHTDQFETEKITAQLLVDAICRKRKIKPAYVRIPMIVSGEKALDNQEPLKSIFKKLKEIETYESILTASFFIGFAWADTNNSSASVIVVPKTKEDSRFAQDQANDLAKYIYERRYDFKFDAIALESVKAINKALETNSKPIFISDSGDNTTGGAVGTNTCLLETFLEVDDLKDKKVCIAAIYDEKAFLSCENMEIGDEVLVNIGVNDHEHSKSQPIKGKLKVKGQLLGFLGGTSEIVGNTCTISMGDLDIVVANKGHSFITMNHFKAAGLDIHAYDVIVVKQGYLFPELSQISTLDILALTPGATYQLIEKLKYKRVRRPIFPLDKEPI